MTMPAFRKILATTTLCLAAVGLSSCYSTLHKYAWNRAKVIDEAYWVQDENNIELYRAGNTVYAKVFVGAARGDLKYGWKGNMLCLRGGSYSCYTPIPEKSKAVYVQLSESYPKLRAEMQQNRRKYPELYQDDSFHVSWWRPELSPYQLSLPAGAVRLTERGEGDHIIGEYKGYKPHTDAHKYYAYPLGALVAVAVDAPLTIAGNTLLVGGAVVVVPFSCLYELYKLCTQNAPSAEPTAQPATQPQNTPSI